VEVVLFELVHTYTDWYDGPIGGLADYQGRPHIYEAQRNEQPGTPCFGPLFRLSPVDQDTLALALEDWGIWLRWDEAFQAGLIAQSTYPALPSDRPRYEELQGLLAGKLVLDPERAFFMCGELRCTLRGAMEPLTEVRWYPPT
jgi:hypothetical protein